MTAEKTIFLSRAGSDAALAEGIGKALQAVGYRVVLQQWDFPNSSFINQMHEALRSGARVIGLLSPDYLASDYCVAEWQAAIADDPLNRNRRLILLRVKECSPDGLLRPLAYWDLIPLCDDPLQLAEAVRNAVRVSHRPDEGPDGRYYRQPQVLFDPDALRRAPNFTGREDELASIAVEFGKGSATVAIYGLAGTGKSAIASAYASENATHYAAIWRLAAETETGITDGLVAFGSAFIPELQLERDQAAAASRVLTTIAVQSATPILIIFDNAESEDLVRKWSPSVGVHILITTRTSAWGGEVSTIRLAVLPMGDAIQYLQRESGRADLDREDARAVAHALGRLPLALAQAAAYLKRTKNVTARRYLERITHHIEHVAKNSGYDRPVFATFLEAIAKSEQEAPGAASMLCLASFFAPDAIPEELLRAPITGLDEALSPSFPESPTAVRTLQDTLNHEYSVDEALGALDRLSLITFDVRPRTFSIHRLVQAVGRRLLGDEDSKWLARAIAALDSAFPVVEYADWPACERLLQHALAAIDMATMETAPRQQARLAGRCATYLHERASFIQAERLFRRALTLEEANYGPDHPNVGVQMNNLALLLSDTNRLTEAEPLFRRTLAIDEATYGAEHEALAVDLNNLAELLHTTNRTSEAEPLFRRALAISESSHGPDHYTVAICLNNLAELLHATNRLVDAEPLFRRALSISETCFGPDHPTIAIRLINLAGLLCDTARVGEAEPLLWRALAISEASYGPAHPGVAVCLVNLSALLRDTERLDDAERLILRALAIDEASYGPDHPTVATDLCNLAGLLRATEREAQAEVLFRRALAIDEASYGPDHPQVATDLNNLGGLLGSTNRLADAEALFRRALAINSASYGQDHPSVLRVQRNLDFLVDSI